MRYLRPFFIGITAAFCFACMLQSAYYSGKAVGRYEAMRDTVYVAPQPAPREESL